jgi:hypothetical protein
MTKTITEITKYGYYELKHNLQKYTAIGFAIAAVIHLLPMLLVWLTLEPLPKEVTVRLITEIPPPPIKFIQRAPRVAKEIEVGKEPEAAIAAFQAREFKFERVAVQATTPPPNATQSGRSGEGSVFYGALTGGEGVGTAGWGIPSGATSYGRSFGSGGSGGWGAGWGEGTGFGPNIATEVENTRGVAPGGALARMRDDLVDYTNFQDRFEGLIFQDPRNKRKVQGFFKFYQLEYRSVRAERIDPSRDTRLQGWVIVDQQPGWNAVPQALQILTQYARDSTGINMQLLGAIRLDSRELSEVPMIYMMGFEGEPLYTKEEARNLGKYLRSGGFLFIDDGYCFEGGVFNRKSRQLIQDALQYDAVFERIPNTHKIYHAWEDFAGPPAGDDEVRKNPLRQSVDIYRYLEGVFLNGRLAVLLSTKGYCMTWGAWRFNPPSAGGPLDNTRQLQFGINIIVYALTQPGGIVDQIKAKLAAEQRKAQ